jgi:tRNA threonylcarbamoyladenosine biosynthesis protein TsaB
MRILALESSAKAASVALCEDSELILQYYQNSGHTHSRTLLKMTEDLLLNIGLSIKDLDLIAVASGPGSFTGIRIGVSAAVGLAWGASLPVCGVSTLEAMAYHSDTPEYTVCPVMDARRSQIYNALFLNNNGDVVRLSPDRAISIADLAAEYQSGGKPYMFLGDGARMCYEAFLALGIPCRLAPPLLRQQSAWGVACASLNAPKIPPDALKPNYLRVSQAERERNAKMGQTG